MKKLILFILFISSVANAEIWISQKIGAYNLTVTSITSKSIWSDNTNFSRMKFDNRAGYTMYLSSFAITPTLALPVTSYAAYPVYSSVDPTKPLLDVTSTGFQFVISSAAVPSTSGMWVIIEK